MSIELAAAAVSVLAPYLTDAAKEAAKTVGKETAEGGLKVLGWMREKLTGRAKEALTELEEKPGSQLNQDDLRTQLAKLLKKQPELVPQPQELLSEAKPLRDVMSQTVGEAVRLARLRAIGTRCRFPNTNGPWGRYSGAPPTLMRSLQRIFEV
jgi:hypothetical protein